MKRQQSSFTFQVYHSADALTDADAALLKMARDATATAYAPYSHFHVGAAAQLNNGSFIKGTNQENASYPVGICAERVLLSAVASLHPGTTVETMAVSYDNRNGESNKPIAPCGMCRQALVEFEHRQQHPIRLILGGMDGNIYIIEQSNALLPLSFSGDDLK
ncbi:MAG: cytidine deaminase [Panacibacter sp.]